MDAQRPLAAIHDQYGLSVRRCTREHGFAPGRRAPNDGPRFNVNRDERIISGCRRVDAVAVRREIQPGGKRPYLDSRYHLPSGVIDAATDDPNLPPRAA